MKHLLKLLGVLSLLSVAGCVQYTPPEQSGLVSVRPFPGPNHVCQLLGENDVTSRYLDHTALLIGCPTHERGAIRDRLSSGATVVDRVGDWTLLHQPHFDPANPDVTLQSLSRRYANKTFITYSAQHGTQIEYHDAKGNVALWYPGNTRALPGNWLVQGETVARAQICYRYGTNTRNPVTGVRGAVWQCQPMAFSESFLKETLAGDPFGLASGAIPFVLERGTLFTSEQLKRRAEK